MNNRSVEDNMKSYKKRKTSLIEKYGEDYNEVIKENRKNTLNKKYGVDYFGQIEDSKDKRKETIMERYGSLNSFHTDEWKESVSETWKNKTDEELKEIRDKRIKFYQEKYGVDYYSQTQEFKDKVKETCLEKYGVESHNQYPVVHNKQQMSGFKAKQYKETNIIYRGTYELDFLDKYFNDVEIENGPSISYVFESCNKVYHSDFYLPDYNLIIEIKSEWTYNKYLDKNKDKKKACLEQDFNFIFVIDKNYKELNDLL